jgi:hypothetical protein
MSYTTTCDKTQSGLKVVSFFRVVSRICMHRIVEKIVVTCWDKLKVIKIVFYFLQGPPARNQECYIDHCAHPQRTEQHRETKNSMQFILYQM